MSWIQMRGPIIDALGFFVQAYPPQVLYFFAFPEESLRFTRKRILMGSSLMTALLSALFPAILSALQPPSFYMFNVLANVYMLAFILVFCCLYTWVVRETFMKRLLVLYIVIFYASAQYWLVNMLKLPLVPSSGQRPWSAYNMFSLGLYTLVTAVLLPVMMVLVIRPLEEFLLEVDTGSMKGEFRFASFSTATYLALMIYNDTTDGLFKPIFLFLMLNQCMIYWLLFREAVRRKRDADHRRALEIQQIQYDNIAREMENVRRLRHDMRHHLNALSGMLEQDDTEAARAYLAQLIGSAARREDQVYCRNLTVNGLLQYYTGLARDEGITCQVQAECGELTVPATDLTVLFGNAMENAIRACGGVQGEKWIVLRVGTIGGSLVIEVSNPCRGVHASGRFRDKEGFLPAEAFLSSRPGGGYGLRSMAHMAEQYGGDASFRFDAETGTFITRVRLNLHPEEL